MRSTPPPHHRAISELTARHKRFLKTAYVFIAGFADATGDPEWRKAVFDNDSIARVIGLTVDEASDIANVLDRDFGLIALTMAHTDPSEKEPFRSVFTERGREIARQLIEDDAAAKRAKLWTTAKAVWALALSIVVPVSITMLNQRISRLEKQSPPTTMPSTQP